MKAHKAKNMAGDTCICLHMDGDSYRLINKREAKSEIKKLKKIIKLLDKFSKG